MSEVSSLPTRATRSGERARFMGLSRMHTALGGWVLASAPASPAQGLHHHGPRYFTFYYFYTMCGLEKLGLIDQKIWERNLSALLLRTLVVGR